MRGAVAVQTGILVFPFVLANRARLCMMLLQLYLGFEDKLGVEALVAHTYGLNDSEACVGGLRGWLGAGGSFCVEVDHVEGRKVAHGQFVVASVALAWALALC